MYATIHQFFELIEHKCIGALSCALIEEIYRINPYPKNEKNWPQSWTGGQNKKSHVHKDFKVLQMEI